MKGYLALAISLAIFGAIAWSTVDVYPPNVSALIATLEQDSNR
jgi:hypothetical protein